MQEKGEKSENKGTNALKRTSIKGELQGETYLPQNVTLTKGLSTEDYFLKKRIRSRPVLSLSTKGRKERKKTNWNERVLSMR